MSTPARGAAALIAVGVIASAIVLLRRQWDSEGLLPADNALPRANAPHARDQPPAGGAVGGADPSSSRGSTGATVRREAGPLTRENTQPQPSGEEKDALVIGSRMVPVGPPAAARRREDIVRNLPAPANPVGADAQRRAAARMGDDAGAFMSDAAARAGLPRGTRFAAALSGTTEAIDGTTPIVEKNTDHDVNEGIYFPPDAQLGYANRAGVRGDSGTVALWVEPVDWVGQDANVHSFFRLNEPGQGSYRFHLLKDASYLRFQFVTEQGESNLRVPIDWWPRGEQHHVAATWGDNMLRLYVDGVPLSEQGYEGTLNVAPTAPGYWGSQTDGGTPGAGAILKDTLVTSRPLDDAEIQKLWEGK